MKIKMSLIDNAYDFLNNSLDYFHLATHEDYPEDYKRYWKFSIVNMVQSMELMFKEVLRRENPIFIYENIDRPKKTVSITTALQRLGNIVGIVLEQTDEVIIKKAIDIRNEITHFEIELDIQELATIYVVIFEFLHSFHYRFLGKELHEFIAPEYWEEEASLMEQFKSDLVLYGGVEVRSSYPREIAESQLFTHFKIEGIVYKRIKMGEEAEDREVYRQSHCGDCAVKQGYYHALGCDLEVCPHCKGQTISCGCKHDIDNGE